MANARSQGVSRSVVAVLPVAIVLGCVRKPVRQRNWRLQQVFDFMSQHRSLRGASALAAKRNVLKRFERIELLKKRGQWKQGERVLGLPKTKVEQ